MTTPKPRRTSGPTQPEASRKRGQLLLRLEPELAAELRETARAAGVSVSSLVALAWALAQQGGLADALALVRLRRAVG